MAYGDNGIEMAWLIEATDNFYKLLKRNGYVFDSFPIWWNGIDDNRSSVTSPDWTIDSNKAVRFSRKEDAEMVISGWGYDKVNPWFVATSHEWG